MDKTADLIRIFGGEERIMNEFMKEEKHEQLHDGTASGDTQEAQKMDME